MAQLTIRADEELVERVRAAADQRGRSMNDYVNSVLDAATDPNLAGNEAERVRERLERAGLLAQPAPLAGTRPDPKAVLAAGRRAATGRPVATFVSDGR